MANTLTALAPVIYKAAQTIPRELTGFISSVDTTMDAKMAAKGDSVTVPIITAGSTGDYTPAMTTTAGTDNTPTTVSLNMAYSKQYTWNLTGEEEQSLQNGGDNAKEFLRQQTEQGIRAIVNGIESSIAVEAKENSSRGYGTAGTTPFASDIKPISAIMKILADNGAPLHDGNISLILNTAASLNLKQNVTINNQPSGSPAEQILSGGTMVRLLGANVKESAQVAVHTAGTSSSQVIDGGGNTAIGSVILKQKAGTGTILKGDVVTLSVDTANTYVVRTTLASNLFTIGNPGLRVATADSRTITLAAAYSANIAMHKSAIKLVVRPPYIPNSPIIQTIPVTDPISGLTFIFSRIVGDGMTTYRLNVVYGIRAVQSEFIATLLG